MKRCLALAVLQLICNLVQTTDTTVTTTSMVANLPGATFITEDPNGRSGIYDPATLTIADLPGSDGLVSLPEAIVARNENAGNDRNPARCDDVHTEPTEQLLVRPDGAAADRVDGQH